LGLAQLAKRIGLTSSFDQKSPKAFKISLKLERHIISVFQSSVNKARTDARNIEICLRRSLSLFEFPFLNLPEMTTTHFRSELAQLNAIFEEVYQEADLLLVLDECRGDLQLAIERITQGHINTWGEVKKGKKKFTGLL
jgi:hypothetical protein